MNYKNYFLILFVSLTVLSCKNDDDDAPASFLLSQENLAASYDLTFFGGNSEATSTFQGLPVTVTTTITADTYQTVAIFTAGGTVSIDGEFRTMTTITNGTQTETDTEIQVVDENGSYTLDANTQTLTLSGVGPFFTGTYSVTLFNETQLQLQQELTVTSGDTTIDSVDDRHFTRQ